MNQQWSSVAPASPPMVPTLATKPFGGKTWNIWWKQTGAGATRWENKCMKASLCPSCWACCCPQQKQPRQDDVPGKHAADCLMQDLIFCGVLWSHQWLCGCAWKGWTFKVALYQRVAQQGESLFGCFLLPQFLSFFLFWSLSWIRSQCLGSVMPINIYLMLWGKQTVLTYLKELKLLFRFKVAPRMILGCCSTQSENSWE